MPTSSTARIPFIAALLLASLAAFPARASAAPPLIADDPARPSAITVTDGSTYLYSSRAALGVRMHVACVAFVNHGPRLATKVGLSLAYVDATGTVLGVDFIHPTGKFPVGVRSAFSGGGGGGLDRMDGNCHPIDDPRDALTSTLRYRMGRGAPPTDVAAILVSAREVVYDDGTAWRTDQVPQPGDHVALPSPPPFSAAVANGLPLVSAQPVPEAPVELNDAVSFGPLNSSADVCVVFTNHDPRPAKRVNVALALVDRTGTIADVRTSYNTGTFSQGILIDNSRGACTDMNGRMDGDTFKYKTPGGDLVPIGRIVATPLLVEFADGTSWQNPHPPQAGARPGA